MIGTVFVFLCMFFCVIVVGVIHYKRVPRELKHITESLGISLVRRWSIPDGAGSVLPFRTGPFFSGTYRDMPISITSMINADRDVLGIRVTFHFVRSLAASLFSAYRINPYTSQTIPDAYRDVYLQRIETEIAEMKLWAGNRDKAGRVLRGGDVPTRLARLCAVVDAGGNGTEQGVHDLPPPGFMINDRGVSVFVGEASTMTRELLDAVYDLAQVLDAAGDPDPGPAPTLKHGGPNIPVIILWVLFMIFIMGMIMAGIFEIEMPMMPAG